MAAAKTATASKGTRKKELPSSISLTWTLAELPSSQHRAGLAGLVLEARRLERFEQAKGLFAIRALTDEKLTLEVDQRGLLWAFDDIYSASTEEVAREQTLKDRDKNEIPPLRTEEREVQDKKTGKSRTKLFYIYPQVVPRGALLLEYDKTARGNNSPWMKLWRDFVWSILRGVPATREPFEARAAGEPTSDSEDAWQALAGHPEETVDLPSTYYLGAQATTAESVPFFDRKRYQFLLHFWPLTASLYVPQTVDPQEDKRDFHGFAVAVPDVRRLKTFSEEIVAVWEARTDAMNGYRPAECVVDVAVEGALDMTRRLRERVAVKEGDRETSDLVFGFDVVHTNKEGNNIRTLSVTRLDPDRPMVERYEKMRKELRDPFFRRQRLMNLVHQRRWFDGFDRLLATLPHKKQGIGSAWFCHDARFSFDNERTAMSNDEQKDTFDGLEQTIFRLTRTYVLSRLHAKYALVWEQVKGTPREAEYREQKGAIARGAFLAVRSRTGNDFLEYFAGTIGAVRQPLSEENFIAFTKALRAQPDDARTLTLLALSANS